jgi:hypothetical protein
LEGGQRLQLSTTNKLNEGSMILKDLVFCEEEECEKGKRREAIQQNNST